MITVSYLNGIYNYGIDLSNQDAEVFEITLQEFSDIRSGIAYMDSMKVVYKVKTEEEIKEEKKQELITKMQELQKEAIEKRNEYTTTRDMLPEGNPIREMKLQKLDYEGTAILQEFESIGAELVKNFGESVLLEII